VDLKGSTGMPPLRQAATTKTASLNHLKELQAKALILLFFASREKFLE